MNASYDIGTLLYENEHYRVFKRAGVFDTVMKGHTCYALVNRRTGVLEAEGLSEVDAYMAAEFRSGQLTEFESLGSGSLTEGFEDHVQ